MTEVGCAPLQQIFPNQRFLQYVFIIFPWFFYLIFVFMVLCWTAQKPKVLFCIICKVYKFWKTTKTELNLSNCFKQTATYSNKYFKLRSTSCINNRIIIQITSIGLFNFWFKSNGRISRLHLTSSLWTINPTCPTGERCLNFRRTFHGRPKTSVWSHAASSN